MSDSKTVNYYNFTEREDAPLNPLYRKEHIFKVSFRCAIIAASGAGKTNTILNILGQMGPVFCKVVLCVSVPDEPLYNLLKEKLGDKLEIYTGEKKAGGRRTKAIPNIPPIDSVGEKDLDGWKPALMIFDDLMLYDDQSDIETFFIRGRKKAISSIYAAQSYYKIPITIRRNIGYLILKRNVLSSDLKKIFNLCSFSITFTQFVGFYREATSNMQDFLLIDLENSALFKSFNTTPLYSTYEYEKQVEEMANQAAPEHKEFPEEERRYSKNHESNIIRNLGVDAYLKILVENRVGTVVIFTELYEKYSRYAGDNGWPVASRHYFSRQLNKGFEKIIGSNNERYFVV